MLSIMLKAKDEETGAKMTEARMRDNIFTFLLAANETTANCLNFALYLLSKVRFICDTLDVVGQIGVSWTVMNIFDDA